MSKAQLTHTRSEIQRTVCLNGFNVGVVLRVTEQTTYTRRNAITAWCSECGQDVGVGGAVCPKAPHHFQTEQDAADAVGEHALSCDFQLQRMCAAKAVA